MKILALSLLLFTSTIGNSEINEKKLFRKASSEFAKGNYEGAILKYEELSKLDETNSEYHFLTGLSYYKSRKDLSKAILCFNNSIETFDGDTIAEAYYYLGKTYREQGEFEKAKKTFQIFEGFIKDNEMGNALKSEVEVEYQWVNNAITHENRLKNGLRVEDMSSDLNSVYGDYAPVYVEDLDLLVFTSRRPGISNELAFDNKYYEDIYFCKRRDSIWVLLSEEEHEFIFDVKNTKGHDSYIAYEGKKDLYLYKDNKIYQTKFEDGEWKTLTEFEIANDKSKHTPSVAFSPDGKTLYFSHKQKLGKGGKDIYQADLGSDGEWSKPKNLAINTAFDEDGPFVSRDGKTLYFSSKGHNSMGGFDFFKLDLTDENAKVIRMAEPYNSLADDIFIDISNDERHGFISSNRNGSIGDMDIFEIFYKPYETVFDGLAIYKNDNTPADVEIVFIDKETGKEIKRIKPDPKTGTYNIALENNKTYLIKVNGSKDNQSFSSEFIVPDQDKDISSVQLITLESLMNKDGENNANTLTIQSDFNNNDKDLSLNNSSLDKTSSLYYEINERIDIDLVSLVDTKFERFFGYNQNKITNEQRFSSFMTDVEKLLKKEGKLIVKIDASASKVPTRTFGTNQKLANKRASVSRVKIEEYFKEKGIDISNSVSFVESSKVQGPKYKNDFEKNRSLYEKFQFVKIEILKAK